MSVTLACCLLRSSSRVSRALRCAITTTANGLAEPLLAAVEKENPCQLVGEALSNLGFGQQWFELLVEEFDRSRPIDVVMDLGEEELEELLEELVQNFLPDAVFLRGQLASSSARLSRCENWRSANWMPQASSALGGHNSRGGAVSSRRRGREATRECQRVRSEADTWLEAVHFQSP